MFKKTAQYYNSNGLWLYLEPNESTPLSWGTIQDMPESAYNRRFNQIKWKNSLYEHLYAVSGKRDIRAIIIKRKFEEVIPVMLKKLKIPEDYEWVLEFKNYYAVIIKVKETIPMLNAEFKGISVLWEGGLIELPKKGNKYPKFVNGLPKESIHNVELNILAETTTVTRHHIEYIEDKIDEDIEFHNQNITIARVLILVAVIGWIAVILSPPGIRVLVAVALIIINIVIIIWGDGE